MLGSDDDCLSGFWRMLRSLLARCLSRSAAQQIFANERSHSGRVLERGDRNAELLL